MKYVACVVLAVVFFIIFALSYYLFVGYIIFKKSFGRKNSLKKLKNKNIDKLINKYKIDLCWWDKNKFKKVETESFDKLGLVGYYFDNSSENTALVVHGYGQSYKEMQPYCKMFFENNFNVLSVDCRAHGESEGECVGFAVNDCKDVLKWIDFLVEENDKTKIVLFGLSMGGSAVCLCAGKKLKKNVKAIISDCAFDNADMQMMISIRKRFGIFSNLVKKHLYSYLKRLHNFSLKNGNILKSVNKTQTPILYIHGTNDSVVLLESQNKLYNETPQNLREKFVVDGAEHAMSYATDNLLYEKKVCDFLRSRTDIRF